MNKLATISTIIAVLFSSGASFADCSTNVDKKEGNGDVTGFSYWPIESPNGRGNLTQDYAQYWHHHSAKDKLWQHHTAFDIGADANAEAVAVADGWVAALIYNGKSDHGFGNTVIINVGTKIYALYAHLDSIDSLINLDVQNSANCKWIDKFTHNGDLSVQEYKCQPGAVPIGAGQNIGVVGQTGATEGSGPILHFEVRDFADLVWKGADVETGDGFGYTHCFPNEDSYKDPTHYLDVSHRVYPPYLVQVTSAGVHLYDGPNTQYPAAPPGVTKGEEFYVQLESDGQGGDSCSSGWADVTLGPDNGGSGEWPGIPPDAGNTTFFDIGSDTDGENYVPALWICKDYLHKVMR